MLVIRRFVRVLLFLSRLPVGRLIARAGVYSVSVNFSSSLQNPSQASATTSMAGVYSVSVTNSNSCSNSATTSVVVYPKPSITIASNSPVCEGTTISSCPWWDVPSRLPVGRLIAGRKQVILVLLCRILLRLVPLLAWQAFIRSR
ncbi:MAG: hypothetical protein U0Y10_26730 [Spirosomataceae bacterium]